MAGNAIPSTDPGVCCICGQPIKSGWCRHPWGKAFSEWPAELMTVVRRLAPNPWPVEGDPRG